MPQLLPIQIAIIGGGPAGLRAAEVAAGAGARVALFESQASVGRKLLVAGSRGLNLTRAATREQLLPHYTGPGMPPDVWPSLLAEFDDVAKVLAASKELRDAGFTRWDVHTPIPIHGLDEAMGIRMSKLPWLVLGGGAAGLAAGLGLQWFTNAFDYPFLISGKPFFGLPAAVPVTVELTILLASLGAVGGLFGGTGWPRLHNPLFASERFLRVTTDRYFVSVDQADPKFDPDRTARILASFGAVNLETVEE